MFLSKKKTASDMIKCNQMASKLEFQVRNSGKSSPR